jgi:hypothetical protein
MWTQKNVKLPFTNQMTHYTTQQAAGLKRKFRWLHVMNIFHCLKYGGGFTYKLWSHCKCGPINIVPCCDHVTFWTKVGDVLQSHISMALCTKHLYSKPEEILCFDILYLQAVSEMWSCQYSLGYNGVASCFYFVYVPAWYSWFQWHVLFFRRGGKYTCNLIEGVV